jgi:hypothetical protein
MRETGSVYGGSNSGRSDQQRLLFIFITLVEFGNSDLQCTVTFHKVTTCKKQSMDELFRWTFYYREKMLDRKNCCFLWRACTELIIS